MKFIVSYGISSLFNFFLQKQKHTTPKFSLSFLFLLSVVQDKEGFFSTIGATMLPPSRGRRASI